MIRKGKAVPLGLLIGAVFFIILFSGNLAYAQKSTWKRFRALSCPEKKWVVFHPFVAQKALIISDEARKMSKSVANDRSLDGDENGGQIDAYRHCFWMARLSQEIHWRKAKKLGVAHEKGNKKDFKKAKLEEGTLPDAISCKMDLLNNSVGIEIGKAHPETDPEGLSVMIKEEILKGNLWIIKKNIKGNFLDCNNNILPNENYQGKWKNDKCLVNSDFKRPR